MKKLFIVFILFVTLFPKLDAQIFYNIEKPPSYQKQGLIDINKLPSINFDVDNTGNLIKDKVSINLKDKLEIEKNGDKIIGRVKFNVASLSLGEITLRFSDVHLNNGAYCYVYTSDYQIVAGPIYQKSINDMLNIVKIPTNELVLEIVFNSEKDYNLIFTYISFQSIEDNKQKSKNSLQDDGAIWDCNNYGVEGNHKYCDNISPTYTEISASYLGAWYDCELLDLHNLYSVTDEKIAAGRASCIIMEPPHFNTEPPNNWIDYWGANSGTLMNFPESNCEGIIFTAHHLGFISLICSLTVKQNEGLISLEEEEILHNTIIRFNWHHKYGKPLHLTGCNQSDFALWRKTIDFDEVIDYCGISGVAYSPQIGEFPDYAILKMHQTPFYKELHLGWTTQRNFDYLNSNRDLTNPSYFSILGRHAATPTYLLTNSGAYVENMNEDIKWVNALILTVIDPNDPPLPPPPYPQRNFSGWSGSQLLYPYYNDINERIGLGITLKGSSTSLKSYTYRDLFYIRDCNIIDTNLQIVSPSLGNDLYHKYLIQYQDQFIHVTGTDPFYYMPSKENKDLCPSPMASNNEPCDFNFGDYINAIKKDGKIKVIIDIGRIGQGHFPSGQMPKGIRIYHAAGDQETFYFDTFADSIDIPSTIEFEINQCDLFYYQTMGFNPLLLGFDFYDNNGKILNAPGCNMTYACNYTSVSPCDAVGITYELIPSPPPCCNYKIHIKFNGCKDYSYIFRKMLENSYLININNADTTLLSSQTNFTEDYESGEISFMINNVCDSMSFKLVKSFGNNFNCGSFDFDLSCPYSYPPIDCCMLFHLNLLPVLEADSTNNFIIDTKKFYINFGELYNGRFVWPQCLFDSAHVLCPNPNVGISVPFYDKTIIPPDYGIFNGDLGSFEGNLPGTYCFYAVIYKSSGICYDTVCVDYDGTNWEINWDIPPIIEIDNNNNMNQHFPISTKFDFEQIFITDINGKTLLESKPVKNIDVSKLPKGNYNILYKKKKKVLQSQNLIIK